MPPFQHHGERHGGPIQLVAEGTGVALMPRSGLEEGGDVVTIAVTHPVIDRRIVLAWRPEAASPAARAFITLAREHLGPRAAWT
jgi:DNA-binding transcriptional LysR family regulator